ncbi:carbonate dehydratase [Hahella sp. CCB-MM4]|nr:carbonate dehydratase [Hahella sp. CCB-MM4]
MPWVALLEGMAFSPEAFSEDRERWSYSGKRGPAYWATLDDDFASCGQGKNQSPINLTQLLDGELPEIELHYPTQGDKVINNGHTVQVNFPSGNILRMEGQAFELKQFHFHSPSENTINGQSFPLEAHFVHADKRGNLAVVGVMFEQGAANEGLQPAWNQLPLHAGGQETLDVPIDATKLMPSSLEYYRFNGSLTTPPCTEGVRWLVLKEPVSISKEQVEAFQRAIPFDNNRPVQPVNARVIVQ